MDKNKVIESASKLIAKGQLEKAVREFQRVLEVDPDDVRILQKLAELYQKMQRREEAADCFEKVAKTYAAQGFYLKAVALYKQVLKVVDRIEVNVRLAELYQQLGLVGDATKEWQNVAAYYEKVGDLKASLDTLKKLVDLDPDNVAARIRLGEQYARQDNLVEAVAELRRAAAYLQRNGRQDDYIRVAERISHLDQGDVALARELAENYLSRGDSKRALAKLQICFKANPRDLQTLQMLARAFQELGQVSKTVSVLKELARVHIDGARPDEARRVYKQAQELAPEDAEIRSSLKTLEEQAAPAPAPVKRASAPGQRPPTGPIARPPTGPIQARPPTGPIATGPVVPPPSGRNGASPISTPPPSGVVPAAPPKAEAPAGPVSVPKLLKETEVYVKYGLHEKALEHLKRIFAVDPENVDAHEKAKTLALNMNRPGDAAASLAMLVRLYVARSDPRADGAKAELQQIDPANPALQLGPGLAAAKAADFGEEEVEATVVDPPRAPAPAEQAAADDEAEVLEETEAEVVQAEAAPAPSEQTAAPAPSDGVEEAVEVGEVMEDAYDDSIVAEPEDVFGASPAAPSPAARAPSSPGAGRRATSAPGKAARAPSSPGKAAKAPTSPGLARQPAAAPQPPPVEEDAFAGDLAEADFYIQAGLGEDAKAILEAILLAEPGHAEATRRLTELGAPPEPVAAPAPPPAPEDADAGQTMLDARPITADAASPEGPPVTGGEHDELAAELAAELASEVEGMGTAADPDVPLDTGPLDAFQVPAHEVLGEFRAKVQEAVRPEDAQTHYDLGIAYKEMGLLDEAIAEFELALKFGGGVRKVDCISILGVCAMEKGQPQEAVKVLKRGLAEPDMPPPARRALGYELGQAYEAVGETQLALECYQTVEKVEPGFRDVRERIIRMGGRISGPIGKPRTGPIKKGPASSPPPSTPPAAASRPPPPASPPAAAPPAPSAPPPAAARPPQPPPAAAATDPAKPAPEPTAEQRRNRKIGFV